MDPEDLDLDFEWHADRFRQHFVDALNVEIAEDSPLHEIGDAMDVAAVRNPIVVTGALVIADFAFDGPIDNAIDRLRERHPDLLPDEVDVDLPRVTIPFERGPISSVTLSGEIGYSFREDAVFGTLEQEYDMRVAPDLEIITTESINDQGTYEVKVGINAGKPIRALFDPDVNRRW